jgi:DNA-binding GntR family transcriptional regulator
LSVIDAIETRNSDVGEDILKIHIARAGRRLANNSKLFDIF